MCVAGCVQVKWLTKPPTTSEVSLKQLVKWWSSAQQEELHRNMSDKKKVKRVVKGALFKKQLAQAMEMQEDTEPPEHTLRAGDRVRYAPMQLVANAENEREATIVEVKSPEDTQAHGFPLVLNTGDMLEGAKNNAYYR